MSCDVHINQSAKKYFEALMKLKFGPSLSTEILRPEAAVIFGSFTAAWDEGISLLPRSCD